MAMITLALAILLPLVSPASQLHNLSRTTCQLRAAKRGPPAVGPSNEPLPTRLHWLASAMQRLVDQCAGVAPLTPYADLRLPCGGRDVLGMALSSLDISGGNETARAMRYLRKLPGPEISF